MKKKQKRELKGKSRRTFARVMRIVKHFFPDFSQRLNRMNDPRDRSHITYSLATLLCNLILKNLTGIVSMRAMNDRFNTDSAIACLRQFSEDGNLEELPDWQTCNNLLERMDPDEVMKVQQELITDLIRTNQFGKGRRNVRVNGCWPVILDGTGYAFFRKPHCEHDLISVFVDPDTKEKKPLYYHKVLVARIVLDEYLVLTIGVEFIENERADVKKQDCENRAAKRLLKRLRESFPKLPVVILGDALYGVEPLMELCRSDSIGWHYLFNLKEGTQKVICADFGEMIKDPVDGLHTERISYRREQGTATWYNGMEKISNKEQIFNVVRYVCPPGPDGKGEGVFQWVTDMEITEDNVKLLVRTGRRRWMIENQGFNRQKNGIFGIEHHCSMNSNGMKLHFLITQIADLLNQLFLLYDDVLNQLGEEQKAVAADLLVSIMQDVLTADDIEWINARTALHKHKE